MLLNKNITRQLPFYLQRSHELVNFMLYAFKLQSSSFTYTTHIYMHI